MYRINEPEHPMKAPTFHRALSLLPLMLLLAWTHLSAQEVDGRALAIQLDSAAAAHAEHEMVAGVSVAVVRGSDTLLIRGYGLVDLEWGIGTPEEGAASYEIGSMTKQFTSVAILQLVEEGRIDLDADVTTYLPDYDPKGRRIPVRRLLDHTSGIKGYTEMPIFGEISVRKLPRDTLVSLVEAEPFDFEPGHALIYNNTGFFLLGLIIEEVTGKTYEEYVTEHLFQPLEMGDSYYCSESAVREDRAHGYDGAPGGLIRARYLDHTWPYAAGSICSTAGDLIRWNQELHGGRILEGSSYEALITPAPLEDGTPVRYAMGLSILGEGNRKLITHGGGINGFLSDGRYYPEEELTIVVLQNSTGPQGPGALSGALAELILGPEPELKATPFDGDLDDLVGDYTGASRGRSLTLEVTRDGDDLVFQPRGTTNEVRPTHLKELTWGMGNTLLWFVREGGRVVEARLDQGGGHYVLKREGEG
jgi:CubicO group peptidase (beta-lactamase class C family)